MTIGTADNFEVFPNQNKDSKMASIMQMNAAQASKAPIKKAVKSPNQSTQRIGAGKSAPAMGLPSAHMAKKGC